MTKQSDGTESSGTAEWAQELRDPAAFAHEQEILGTVWTLLGLRSDAARDGDWFTARLGCRPVFVQNFNGTLKGFENKCAHRFMPLRNGDRGNGAVVCGFHHWRYNGNGLAVGIPACEEMFGATPRELDIKLTPVEIDTCGALVFGRFPGEQGNESLREFLGQSYDIIRAFCPELLVPRTSTYTVKANWRLNVQIVLDDYHIVAVHPGTFAKIGYLHREEITYEPFGPHSLYFSMNAPNILTTVAAACRNGTYRPRDYLIFNLFPNLALSHFHAFTFLGMPFWYCVMQQFVPHGMARTQIRSWLWAAPFPTGDSLLRSWLRAISEPIRERIVNAYVRRVLREDMAVCELLQNNASYIQRRPKLAKLEERVAWFDETHSRTLKEGHWWTR